MTMEVYGVGQVPDASAGATGSTIDPAQNALGKDAFLRLLVAQLQYQNPLEPMKDQEFVAQLAQFSALEELGSVRAAVEQLAGSMGSGASLFEQGLSLLGFEARVRLRDGQEYAGEVTGVRRDTEGTTLLMGAEELSLADIEEVEIK